ncbi:unnamed protein product [Brachionus calyciflorus]|uniref:Uncharacterized protein n=1 Tax=Brachionus calyciflorus TaxID=104777 RepID=A0A814K077_9BILA|nr:unnamed protein product [Brachionus calyciflorus]
MLRIFSVFLISKLISIVNSEIDAKFCGYNFCYNAYGPVFCCGFKLESCCYINYKTFLVAGSSVIGSIIGICLLVFIVNYYGRLQNKNRRDLTANMNPIGTINLVSTSSLADNTLVQTTNELSQ